MWVPDARRGGACPSWDAENAPLSTLESPAHTQHDLAGHQIGLHLLVLQAAGIREVVPATFGIAHVDVAIAEVQGQAIRHVVGNAGAEGPGQVGLGRGAVLARLVTLPAFRFELGQAQPGGTVDRQLLGHTKVPIGIEHHAPGLDVVLVEAGGEGGRAAGEPVLLWQGQLALHAPAIAESVTDSDRACHVLLTEFERLTWLATKQQHFHSLPGSTLRFI